MCFLAYSTHFFPSSSHSVSWSKNCMTITSDGLKTSSLTRILKTSLANVAFSNSVALFSSNLILQDPTIIKQTDSQILFFPLIFYLIHLLKRKKTKLTSHMIFQEANFFHRKSLIKFNEQFPKRNIRPSISVKLSCVKQFMFD